MKFVVVDSGENYVLEADSLLDAQLAALRKVLQNDPSIWRDIIYSIDLDVIDVDNLESYV